ncbi:hypothetical protein [Rugamonas sp.]|uniref:hypothetical protein n=1 Tax=Rugamonas sp. TaxID=1926287 RepID=UPI0025F69EC6|nr:hypothetical protein [Rugamonas sp.]
MTTSHPSIITKSNKSTQKQYQSRASGLQQSQKRMAAAFASKSPRIYFHLRGGQSGMI